MFIFWVNFRILVIHNLLFLLYKANQKKNPTTQYYMALPISHMNATIFQRIRQEPKDNKPNQWGLSMEASSPPREETGEGRL